LLLGGIGLGFSSFIFVTAWNLYNWPHFCCINRVQLSVYPCCLQVVVGHAVKYIIYPIFITVINVTCEMDDSPIRWTGQHLWVSLVSTVHTLLVTSWCWTVLYVLPSKMSLLHLLQNLRMVPHSVLLFSVFLEDTPQACNIHGEDFDGNEYGTWK
jgi:hypothetical protein